MKCNKIFLIIIILLITINKLQSQTNNLDIENAISIVEKNKNLLDNVSQLLVVFNEKQESFTSVFVALEKKEKNWVVKQSPIEAGIGKNGFALPNKKVEGDGKSPTGIFRLGKLFSYKKQLQTLLENQQTTKDDKWIDDVNSPDYNKHIVGSTNAKSFENMLLDSDVYKFCAVIEYNTNPIVKGKGSAIFLHLSLKPHSFTSGCVAIREEYMMLMINWLDPKQSPTIIMGNLDVLKAGLYSTN
jgi:L,D-peptidoglycan transpeptidase YkuD (ErfK/YbiS/YcfS/YnhG family)